MYSFPQKSSTPNKPRKLVLKCIILYLWFKKKSLQINICRDLLLLQLLYCGERGIRTPGTVARTPHFECGPIDHSGISPNFPDSGFPCPLRLRLCTARRPGNLRFGTANIDKIFIFAHPAAKKTLLNPKKVHIAAPNGRSVPNYAYLCSQAPMQYFPRTPVYRAKTILKSVRFSFY